MRPDLVVLNETLRRVADIDQSPCVGCDACGARCTAGVPMLRAEFQAIAAYLAGPDGAEARTVQEQEKRLPYPGTEAADGATYEACRFRDVERGRCSIYPVRPVVCRLFGHAEWLPCPIEKVPVWSGGREVLEEYTAVPHRTYEQWLAAEPPPSPESRVPSPES
jgi:ferredoxin